MSKKETNNNFYIGQIFKNEYPPEAAEWCNEQEVCHIQELEPIKGIRQFKIVANPQPTAEEEKERIAKLSLTAADVERALYKALGKDFDDIIEMVQSLQPEGLDIKALKIELKANKFYRGNPYISQIGALLCISETQLDEFFKTNNYLKLLPDMELIPEDEIPF